MMKNRFNIHKKYKENKGFTLVEMIVVLLVLAIIIGLSAFGILSWQDWTHFQKMNEYAENLYVAGNNQMQQIGVSGQMEAFVEHVVEQNCVVLDFSADNANRVTDYYGNEYDLENIWTQSVGKSDKTKKSYQGTIYSAMCVPGDYMAYHAGNYSGMSNPSAMIVFELLKDYVYDTSILNAAICIEFSPEAEQVFAVCYSDLATAFEYNNSNSNLTGTVNVCVRESGYRKNRMVGYYGVDTLARSIGGKLEQPVINAVKLINEDTLNLSFQMSKIPAALNQLTYDIVLYDKQSNKPVLKLVLDGTQVKNYDNRQAIYCETKKYLEDGTEVDLGSMPFIAWTQTSNDAKKAQEMRVVFDAADMTVTSQQLENALETIQSNPNASSLKESYSIMRFGLRTEDVYCTIQGYGAQYKSTSRKASNHSHILFATDDMVKMLTTSAGVSTYHYGIENARHLYNVRYVQDIENMNLSSNSFLKSGIVQMEFILRKDVDWEQFVENGNLYISVGDITPQMVVNQKVATDKKVTGEGASKDGKVLTSSVTTLVDSDFPSIMQLKYQDDFTGLYRSVVHTISGLRMTQACNDLYDVYRNSNLAADEIKSTGAALFLKNFGTIESTRMDKITVLGGDRVAAFCGTNAGLVQKLTVLNTNESSLIKGYMNVGGVLGCQTAMNQTGHTTSTVLKNKELVNYAPIQGYKYIGGIVGMAMAPVNADMTIEITDCKNYGAITTYKNDRDARKNVSISMNTNLNGREVSTYEAGYIGGIVGFSANFTTDVTKLKIQDCTSSPQYSTASLQSFLAMNNEELRKQLSGIYVGGIVGYNFFGTINHCNTEPEQRGKTGYVFGNRYVGGIVGFNQGPANAIAGNRNNGDRGTNEANVFGQMYVGGITGCNSDKEGADIDVSYTNTYKILAGEVVVPVKTRNMNMTISHWINCGVIYATDAYAGGITGYNTGWLYDCSSDVVNAEHRAFFQETHSGDYAGGIAGYNNGIIGNTPRVVINDGKESNVLRDSNGTVEIVCNIAGTNYVGGIVGYNDVDAIVEDYAVSGGYIRGKGNFVGGFAGLNSSVSLLMNDSVARHIAANPNEVDGQYFVGGSIGGNIINVNGRNITQVNAIFKTDNFLGTLTAKAFAGGFVGYNLFFDNDATTVAGDLESSKGVEYVLQRDILKAFEDSEANAATMTEEDLLTQKIDILEDVVTTGAKTADNIFPWNIKPTSFVMNISGSNNAFTQNTLGVITADIYAGGVIGYNDDDTYLYIKQVMNTTPIRTTKAITRANEQKNRVTDYAGRAKEYLYSYAGGIVGRVSKKTTIDNCYNTASGTVNTIGTYTGGLCEINAGTIRNCNASVFGSSVKEYVGSICGLNEKDAVIENCSISGVTITGRNLVAGIAAENFGLVKGTKADTTRVVVSGKEFQGNDGTVIDGVGAVVVGYNAGTVEMSDDIVNATIRSNGNNVGIVCGINEGLVENKKSDAVVVSGNVSGYQNVGGIIGQNNSKKNGTISGYVNQAGITATHGNAGGIIGNNASDNMIVLCENYGEVIATQEGNAGGITASNASTIRNCKDYAIVSSKNGIGAGITAINEAGAKIENCEVRPVELTDLIEFSSLNVSGGICGENYGTIANAKLTNVDVVNLATSTSGDIGVVTGRNMATGIITFAAGSSITDCNARTYINETNVGGVCGVNYGTIEGAALVSGLPVTIINANVEFVHNTADTANFGGVAGKNLGSITKLSVVGDITGNLGSEIAGYGGITGYTGITYLGTSKVDSDNNPITCETLISNCTFDGTLRANGAGAGYARIGGIAGINAYDSVITDCAIGVVADADDEGNRKETAILAGNVEAKDILDGTVTKNTSYGQQIIKEAGDKSSYAYIGGMVGENYNKVLSCDNYTYSTDAVRIESFAGISGGIVGITYADSEVTGTQAKHLSTGANWQSIMRSVGNEAGQGGVIGNCFSHNDMSYIDNHMNVTCVYSSGTSTSGVIGRLDQGDAPELLLSNIRNYGNVIGYDRAAGIIAVLKGKGATLEHCTNYGKMISIHTSHGSGGIICEINRTTSDVNLIDCKNHGLIYGRTAAYGLVATSSLLDGAVINVDNCVNTGIVAKINSNGTLNYATSGIGHFCTGTVHYNNCRNYGTSPNLTYSFGAASSVNNCLDHSGRPTTTALLSPFANTTNGFNSYYVSKDATATQENSTGVYFNIKPYKNVYNGASSSQTTNYYNTPALTSRHTYETGSATGIATIDVDITRTANSKEIGAIVIYFGSTNATMNTYDYTVTGIDESGATKVYTGRTTNANNVLANGRVEIPISDIAPNAATLKTVRFDIDPQTSNNVYYFGMSWMDTDGNEYDMEPYSKYLESLYHMKFALSFSERLSNNKAVSTLSDEVFLYDFVEQNRLNLTVKNNDGWEQITVNVDYSNDALTNANSGMKAFCFYLTSNNGTSTGKTGAYSYYAVFTDRDGNSSNVGSKETPLTLNNATYSNTAPYIIEVPADVDKKIQTIDFYILNTNNSKNIYMRGFKWIPSDGDTPILMPYNDMTSSALSNLKSNALFVEENNGEYLLYPEYYNADYAELMEKRYITMTRNNPIADSYYTDLSEYNPAFDEGVIPDANTRAGVYKELDPLFERFVMDAYSGKIKLAQPIGLTYTMTNTNGRYKFSWNIVNGAYGYETYYQLVDTATKEVRYDSSSEGLIMTPASIKYHYYDAGEVSSHYDPSWGNTSIVFHVRAVNGYRIANPDAEDAYDYDSDWATPLTKPLALQLPQPVAHFEVIAGNKVIAVLDNVEDYEAFKDVCEVRYLVDANNSINGSTKEVIINPATGFSEPFAFTNISADTDYTKKIYAMPKTEYKDLYVYSVATLYFGTMMSTAQTASTTPHIKTAFLGLQNTTIKDLAYEVQLIANNRDFYVGAAMIVPDDKLGVDVAVASGSQRASNRITKTDVYYMLNLTGFAEKILDKSFEVKSYYEKSQGESIWYGRIVADAIPAEELIDNASVKAIKDDKYFTSDGQRITQSICDDSGKLRPGYILIDNQNGTYTAYYNALVELDLLNSDSNYQVQNIQYTLSEQTDANGYYFYDIASRINNATTYPADLPIQVKPIIEEEYTVASNVQGHDEYTFSWDIKDENGNPILDTDLLYKDAIYSIELIGETVSGDEVTLGTVDNVVGHSYTFVDNLDNWNYTVLKLKIVRNGVAGSNSLTTIVPSIAMHEFERKLKLSTIATPTATLKMIDGHFNKDGLIYETVWDPIVSADEKTDLGGYLIKVEVATPSNPEIVTKTHYYYVVTVADAEIAELPYKTDDTIIYKEVTTADCNITEAECSMDIDLADFNGGDVLNITVCAIAKANAAHYIDGDECDPYQMTLPTRLKTPSMDKMVVKAGQPEYDANSAVVADAINSGVEVQMTSDDTTTGKYELAIAVFDKEGKVAQDMDAAAIAGSVAKVSNIGDASADAVGYWNSGAKENLDLKAASVAMTGNKLDFAEYVLKMSDKKLSDYAGMWFKVAARTTSDNQISSIWSDEDEAAANTVNYFWYQIPRVQVEQANMQMSTRHRYLDMATKSWFMEKNDLDMTVTNRMLTFDTVEYADGYKMQMLSIDGNAYWIYFKNTENGTMEVYYTDTVNEEYRGVALENGLDYMTKLGELNVNDNVVEIPYIANFKTVAFGALLEQEELPLNTLVWLSQDEDGKTTVSMVLPDVLESGLTEDTMGADYFELTGSITLQAYVEAEHTESYESALVEYWNMDDSTGAQAEDKDTVSSGLAIAFAADKTTEEETINPDAKLVYFQWSTADTTASYIIRIDRSVDGNMASRYVLWNASASEEYLAFDQEDFAEGSTVVFSVSYAKILDNGFLGQWTEKTNLQMN